jgi:hypothetical protein
MEAFISSPDIQRRAAGLERANITLIVRDSAVKVADRVVGPLRQAAAAAGASSGLQIAIQVHDGHLNSLVMRDRGSYGDVIVGVDGTNRHADDAEDLEWGTFETPPTGWVRTTVAARRHDVHARWSNEMTRELDRQVLRR